MVNTIKFSQMTDGGDIANDDKTPGLLNGANVLFNNPWTFLPPGTTAQRPTPSDAINYRLRFNTDAQLYEYYDAMLMQWTQLQESFFTAGPFVTYTASVALPDAFNLGTLTNGLLKQTVSTGVATPAIALLDTDYYGPGMVGYLQQPAGIKDINGNIVVKFGSILNATDYILFNNGLTGQVPTITLDGINTDIGLLLQGKGNGEIGFAAANTIRPFNFYSGTNYQHVTNFNMADTAANRTATWQDSDGTVAWLSDVMNTVLTAQGTANQVLVNGTSGSQQVGNIILTTPQDIATTSSPTFNNLTVNGGILSPLDGSLVVNFNSDLNSVNHLTLSSSETGQYPIIETFGSDTNIYLRLRSKEDAGIKFETTAISNYALSIYSGTFNVGTNIGQHLTQFAFANTLATRTVTFQDSSGTVAWLTDITANGTVNAGLANQLAYYAASGNTLSGLASANNAVLITNGSGVPSLGTTLPNINIGTPTAGVLTNTTGGGGLRSFQIFTSGTAQTYTKPANVTSILVEVVGGGGGGGGITAGATTIAASGGGGGGGYCRKFIAAAAGTYTYTVGGGGAGGVGANAGATGTASTFSTLTANGGVGGSLATAIVSSQAFVAPGGAGGTATGGDINVQGFSGGQGINTLTATQSGVGGASEYAGSTVTQTATTANGVAGQLYGGGGGGALGGLSGGTTQNGGAGAAGIIIVWEFA